MALGLYLLAAGGRPDPAMRDWEACRHRVEAAILAAPAKRDGFQPRVPKADTVSKCVQSSRAGQILVDKDESGEYGRFRGNKTTVLRFNDRSNGRTRFMIRNRYLPRWLHRVACGMFGAVVLALLGLNWLGQPSGSWRHIVSLCFLVLSIPVGVILACVAHRFSIVEGLAGDVGYEDLDAKQDDKPPA